MSVRDEIAAFRADNPDATPEEIAKALAITKIEVLGALVTLSDDQPGVIETNPAPEKKSKPKTTAVQAMEAVIAKHAVEADAEIAPATYGEPVPADLVGPSFTEPAPEPTGRIHGWTADEIATLFRTKAILDIYGAAEYLGIERNGVEYACLRGTIKFCAVRGKKLFGRADLDDYIQRRGRGRSSNLTPVDPVKVK